MPKTWILGYLKNFKFMRSPRERTEMTKNINFRGDLGPCTWQRGRGGVMGEGRGEGAVREGGKPGTWENQSGQCFTEEEESLVTCA